MMQMSLFKKLLTKLTGNKKTQTDGIFLQLGDETDASIAPELIGLFYEDINFAGDGGLYAEMIENRSFEAKEAFGTPGYFYAVDDFGYAWSPYSTSKNMPRMQYVSGVPLSVENPHYLRITTSESGQGFANKAYDGICLRKGMSYRISFYARAVTYEGKHFTVRIMKGDICCGKVVLDTIPAAPYMPFSDMRGADNWKEDNPWEAKIIEAQKYDMATHVRQNQWVRYEALLTAEVDTRNASFVITMDGVGAVEFDFISMIPTDAVAGVFRKDLFDALKELHPGFIRFPGGCIIEGISLETRYPWKGTLREPKDRKYIPNLWAFEDNRFVEGADAKRQDSHYGQSFGIGYYEYFLLCELLNAKPLPVLNIGAACQFRSTEIIPIDAPEFEEYVQDALDLIEFANGPVDSKWGAVRAKLGHPKPFGLTMIGIGNEQWETKYLDFYARYDRFEKAIHAVYPDMRLIGSAGPNLDLSFYKEAWDYYRNAAGENDRHCFAVDEHYYVSPEWLYDHYDFYDSYPRTVGVFAGEYAGHPSDRENTMVGALAEAALLCGLERNAEVIKLASYAPLFNNINHSQWQPDMIWFDDKDVFITPSYQVQKMFANNLGDFVLPLKGQELELKKDEIYVSASKTVDGHIILKAVNARAEDYKLTLADAEGRPLVKTAEIQTLQSAGPRPERRPEPSEIVTNRVELQGSVMLKAKTFSIIQISMY